MLCLRLYTMDLQDNQPLQNRQEQDQEGFSSSHSSSRSPRAIQQLPENPDDPPNPIESEDEPSIKAASNEEKAKQAQEMVQAIRTQLILIGREEKAKKKKVRAYVQDFTDYLPESLLIVNRITVPAQMRVGARFQAQIPPCPPYRQLHRSMSEWLVWKGCTSDDHPTEEQLLRFRDLLGENRTQQQFIHVRQRLGARSWKEVLEYIGRNKGQIRRVFHQAQRNRG